MLLEMACLIRNYLLVQSFKDVGKNYSIPLLITY